MMSDGVNDSSRPRNLEPSQRETDIPPTHPSEPNPGNRPPSEPPLPPDTEPTHPIEEPINPPPAGDPPTGEPERLV
jgi:hypothetical protein